MAEPKTGKNTPKPDAFADDVDALLNIDETEPQQTVELIDDDDAIDRLLTGDAFDVDSAKPPSPLRTDDFDEFSDEFADTDHTIDDMATAMKEIDAFPDSLLADTDDTLASDDFLTADFDISSDELDDAENHYDDTTTNTPHLDAQPEPANAPPPSERQAATQPQPAPGNAETAPSSRADFSAAIAALTTQLAELKTVQKRIAHQLEQKAEQEALGLCQASVETLDSGQKTLRRNVETIDRKKPVAAYVASGLALAALLVGLGFGYQASVAKKQIGEIVEFLGKLQKQIVEMPTADAGEKEVLRKQIDELNVANTTLASQLAELSKAVQASGEGKDDGAQPHAGNDRDMQMGAAIEALQTKVAALEKVRTVAAPVAKAIAKKPAAVEQNWAVNLVAFKQDWYAKRKAEEFAAKGIPAKVTATETKGETWYRLSVDGFKTQDEATSYAARVKKTLNLDSVWVARVKE